MKLLGEQRVWFFPWSWHLTDSRAQTTEFRKRKEMKSDGSTGKMVVTPRATSAPSTKIGFPKQKIGFLAKMRRLGPILGSGIFWKWKKVNFCNIIRDNLTKMGVTARNRLLALLMHILGEKIWKRALSRNSIIFNHRYYFWKIEVWSGFRHSRTKTKFTFY